jgi:diaminopimelate epimerase
MIIKFSKYHGCGNDFICIDARSLEIDLVECAKKWCVRGFSVGADGLLALESSATADFKMTVVNADGSIPEMCGNGLRCFVAYLVHQQFLQSSQCNIETDAGILHVDINESDAQIVNMSVQMGSAKVGSNLPTSDFNFETSALTQSITVDSVDYGVVPVSMGNPHAVIFVDDVDSFPVESVGPLIEGHECFPNRVNVEFIQLNDDGTIRMRVWERGVGETNACGTGACAVVVAATQNQLVSKATKVILNGGQLLIDYDSQSHDVIMTGPAELVYESALLI